MAIVYFKLEKRGEMSEEDAHAAVSGAHNIVRIDTGVGKTTIYFTADTKDARSADLRTAARR
jgi:hypothetical protein